MTDLPHPEEREPVVIRNNRKIDRNAPVAADGQTPSAPPAGAPDDDVSTQTEVPMVEAALLDERTADLQRLQAEYANYRKRAERDRLLAGDAAVGRVLADLLPVIDDLERAKAHGDLAGPLKAVADKLEGVTGKLGLVAFGEVGDPFDPSLHEAVLHDESDAVTVPTCTTVMRPGFRLNDRLLRPAMVGVSDPASQPEAGDVQDGPGPLSHTRTGAEAPTVGTDDTEPATVPGDPTAASGHSETPAPPPENESNATNPAKGV